MADAFYSGMITSCHEARETILPNLVQEFAKRKLQTQAEAALKYQFIFHKRIGTHAHWVECSISRFQLELFCCLSAINLYRATQKMEQYKADTLSEIYLKHLGNTEEEWLGIYNAELPDFEASIGCPVGELRQNVISYYAEALNNRNTRDSDIKTVTRLFLKRQQLGKEYNIDVSPVMEESCTQMLEKNGASWLIHYLAYHPL